MCRDCGHFVVASERDGGWTPIVDACPQCDGDSFVDARDRKGHVGD